MQNLNYKFQDEKQFPVEIAFCIFHFPIFIFQWNLAVLFKTLNG